MRKENYASIRGRLSDVFQYAQDVGRWAEILPHYRWVKVLAEEGDSRTVEMAAHRDGFPVRWRAVQRSYPAEGRITFRHIGGFTRGMEVEWTLKEENGWVLVRVRHDFEKPWPLIGGVVSNRIVGDFFVHRICSQTLARIKQLVESAQSDDEDAARWTAARPDMAAQPQPPAGLTHADGN